MPSCGRIVVALLIAPGWFAAAAGQDLDLINAMIIDGTGAPPRAGTSVIVRGGRIEQVLERAPPAVDGVRRIDLQGRFLLPGLIDAHAHIESPAAALRALQSGVTTARVLGDSYLRALGTRDLIRAGHAPGPELLVSAGIIRPRPGEAFFVTFPQFGAALNGELRGPERIAAVTRAMLERGVDVVKIAASERAGVVTADPRRAELTEEEMRAAVMEADRAGRFVAAHAHSRDGAAAAVRAGVRSIEHGTYLDEPMLLEMRRRGTFLVPTLAVMSPLSDPQTTQADDVVLQLRTRQMMAPVRAATRRARELGITVAASTDGSYGDGDATARIRIAHDIAALREDCGFTPLESIQAATWNGARVLGIDARTGTIRPGLEADLLVVERDPLRDDSALFEPLLVVSDGRVVFERP